jgi:Ca2+-binding EF-hand superfamily protein
LPWVRRFEHRSQAGRLEQLPQSQPVAAGEFEAKKLLVLMDADKSGTVSKKEFMEFMEAEFDRLDTNKDGVLDVKELEQSPLMPTHRGGGHR